MKNETEESRALKLINWIADQGIGGYASFSGSEVLASEYLIDQGYENNHERVDSLINWETSKNFTSGFITGLGGLLTLPIAIPSSIGASWIIQARLAGAIAKIYGHSLDEDRIRTFVILSIIGDSGKEVLKRAGITGSKKIAQAAISRVPGKTLIEINKLVGTRLLTKAGTTGVVNLTTVVPILGGLVGGGIDAISCRAVGRTAKHLFRTKDLDE